MHDLNFVVQLAMDAKERPEEWVNICENIVYGKDLGIDKGYGKQLLLWGIQCIRKSNNEPIILHVAEWNKDALMLYKKVGFEIISVERIR